MTRSATVGREARCPKEAVWLVSPTASGLRIDHPLTAFGSRCLLASDLVQRSCTATIQDPARLPAV